MVVMINNYQPMTRKAVQFNVALTWTKVALCYAIHTIFFGIFLLTFLLYMYMTERMEHKFVFTWNPGPWWYYIIECTQNCSRTRSQLFMLSMLILSLLMLLYWTILSEDSIKICTLLYYFLNVYLLLLHFST